jgi:hypothetical protein
MTQAAQQFVDDYLLVVENDLYGWQWHKAVAAQHNNNVFELADNLRDEFEDFVSKILIRIDPAHNSWQVNIMREMLLGWGITPYENIARELLARFSEGK